MKPIIEKKILAALKENPQAGIADICIRAGLSMEEVTQGLENLKARKILVGYSAVVDWDKTDDEIVTALIEVKVTPQRGVGFDRIAKRIYRFDEVSSVYLMAGGYDFCVFIEGKSMKEISRFVFEKLATIPTVEGTSTHFVLRKYKDHGIAMENEKEDNRVKVIL